MQLTSPRLGRWLAFAAAAAVAAGCGSERPDDETRRVKTHPIPRVLSASEALNNVNIPMVDPATMAIAESSKVIGDGPRCEFRYTTAGSAVVAVDTQPGGAAGAGVVKLNGNLVELKPVPGGKETARELVILAADPIRITVAPGGKFWEATAGLMRREATMTFEVGDQLRVGYRGYFDCASKPPLISHKR